MPKFITKIAGAIVATIGFIFAQSALAAPSVEVSFYDRLANNMDNLNDIEIERERNFRDDFDSYRASLTRSARRFDRTRFEDVNWATIDLIPNVENFNVENLIEALVVESLDRVGKNIDGTIRVHIDRLKVANHSLNFLRSNDTYVIGTFEHVDSNGNVVNSTKVSANFVTNFSANDDYQGPDFPFPSVDAGNRVGPALTRFVEKGLENLFEGTDFHGPLLMSRIDIR